MERLSVKRKSFETLLIPTLQQIVGLIDGFVDHATWRDCRSGRVDGAFFESDAFKFLRRLAMVARHAPVSRDGRRADDGNRCQSCDGGPKIAPVGNAKRDVEGEENPNRREIRGPCGG